MGLPLYSKADEGREAAVRSKTGDGRTPYRRDWARLIHSAAFRRLQGKTQLFPSDENDFYRNRLTHSLEVAQIASGIAANINQSGPSCFKEANIDPDLTYFAGLAHDLGHPPFGHNGEKALDKLMARFGGFEGNAQTLRILARLEKKETVSFPSNDPAPTPVENNEDRRLGLNVTYRSLAAVLKYDNKIPRITEDRKPEDKKKPVKGYYSTESELVGRIKEAVVKDSAYPNFKTIECRIMDVADDIAYSTYDLEDAFKAGFLSPLSILAKDDAFKIRVVEEVNKKIEAQYSGDESPLGVGDFDREVAALFAGLFTVSADLRARYPENSELSDEVLSELTVISAGQASSRSAALSNNGYLRSEFTSKLVNQFMSAVSVKLNEDYPQLSEIEIDPAQFKLMELLKTISYEALISSPRLKMAERRGGAIIKKIFKTLANEKEGRRLLPEDWAEVYFGFSCDELRRRTICDFIANMTDRYCVEFYSRIVGLNPPSIHKPY